MISVSNSGVRCHPWDVAHPCKGCVVALKIGWRMLWLRLNRVTWDASWVGGYGVARPSHPTHRAATSTAGCARCKLQGWLLSWQAHSPAISTGWIPIQSLSGRSLGRSQRWSWFSFTANFDDLVSNPKVLRLVLGSFLKCFLFGRLFSLMTWLIFGILT